MTRRPHLYALLTGEPTPAENLRKAHEETKQAIAEAQGHHAKVTPLRSRLKSLTHIRLVEGV